MDKVRKLPENYRKHKNSWTQIKRSKKCAIYKMDDSERYEVIRIRIGHAHPKSEDQRSREMLPPDESFGKWAWAYMTLAEANKKFREVSNG